MFTQVYFLAHFSQIVLTQKISQLWKKLRISKKANISD